MDTTTFIFKRKKSIPYRIASTLMLLWGILWIQYFLFGGIVLSIGSLFFITTIKGIQLDFEKKKYRETRFIGDTGLSNWKNLPEIKYISIFKTTMVQTIRGGSGAGVSTREKLIQLNLIHGQKGKLKVFQTENMDEAYKNARLIAEKLNLRIYDATTCNGKWIDK